MHGRSTKQRRAAERRSLHYAREERRRLKPLCMPYLYGAVYGAGGTPQPMPQPPLVRRFFKLTARLVEARGRALRRSGVLVLGEGRDYATLEQRILATVHDATEVEIPRDEPGRFVRQQTQRAGFDAIYGRTPTGRVFRPWWEQKA